jgi:SAM-dependent methyltransferase
VEREDAIMAAVDPVRPFAATAAFYPHRAPYAPAALDFIARTFGLDGAARVLDLGCGPGTLTVPLAHFAGDVVGLDPEPEMIAQARAQATESGRSNVRWVIARAETLPADLGCFRLVTLGQSFHWMDRDLVLRRLADVVEPGGGLALVNPGPQRPQESWEPAADEVILRFLGPRRLDPARHPEPQHEPALSRSAAFSRFTSHMFSTEFTRDLAGVLGAVYSLSYASKPRFGAQAAAFEAALSEALLALNPSGRFHERVDTEVIVAFRSGP